MPVLSLTFVTNTLQPVSSKFVWREVLKQRETRNCKKKMWRSAFGADRVALRLLMLILRGPRPGDAAGATHLSPRGNHGEVHGCYAMLAISLYGISNERRDCQRDIPGGLGAGRAPLAPLRKC